MFKTRVTLADAHIFALSVIQTFYQFRNHLNSRIMQQMINKVQLMGSVGKDVDFKDLGDGNSIARVSISTKEFYKTKDGETRFDLQWHNLVAWGRIAEVMNVMFQKGKKVAVMGKLAHRTYEDKEGRKRYLSEIVVSEFHLMT